ncbi:hypothetical protein MKW92_034421, partial [Papaver armeniacum]
SSSVFWQPTLLCHSIHHMCCEVCIRRPRILLVIVLDISQVVGNDVEPNINCTRQETNLTKVSIVSELDSDFVCLVDLLGKGGEVVSSRVIQIAYLLDHESQILEACR